MIPSRKLENIHQTSLKINFFSLIFPNEWSKTDISSYFIHYFQFDKIFISQFLKSYTDFIPEKKITEQKIWNQHFNSMFFNRWTEKNFILFFSLHPIPIPKFRMTFKVKMADRSSLAFVNFFHSSCEFNYSVKLLGLILCNPLKFRYLSWYIAPSSIHCIVIALWSVLLSLLNEHRHKEGFASASALPLRL